MILRTFCLLWAAVDFSCGTGVASLDDDPLASSGDSLQARQTVSVVTAQLSRRDDGAACITTTALGTICSDDDVATDATQLPADRTFQPAHAVVQFQEEIFRSGSRDSQQAIRDFIVASYGTDETDAPAVATASAPAIPPIVWAIIALARAVNMTARPVGNPAPLPPPAPPVIPVGGNGYTERTTKINEPAGWCQVREKTVIEDCRVINGVVTNQCNHRLTTYGPVVRMDPCEPFNPLKHANVRVSYAYPRAWAGPQ